MQVKDVKAVLKPLKNIYEIEKVCVGAILTDKFDKIYKNFDEFLEDESIDHLEVNFEDEPVNYDVRGFRFIEEIDIWIKEVQ